MPRNCESNCDPNRAIYRSLRALRAQNRKKSLKRSLSVESGSDPTEHTRQSFEIPPCDFNLLGYGFEIALPDFASSGHLRAGGLPGGETALYYMRLSIYGQRRASDTSL